MKKLLFTVAAVAALSLTALVVAYPGGCQTKLEPLTCKRPVAITAKPGDVVWFGEMHGTNESPLFVGDVVCALSADRKNKIQLGLEIWHTEQNAIDRFLEDGDKDKLLKGPFWAQHDGRSSTAMVELLDRVRWLVRGGAKIKVVAYDVTSAPDRDQAMAIKVIGARSEFAIFIGLSGNIHSRKTNWNEVHPLVSHLVDAKLDVKTHDVSPAGGTMWACMATGDSEPVCGEHPMHDDKTGTPWTLGPAKDPSHDGVYYVGKTSAAFPAKPK